MTDNEKLLAERADARASAYIMAASVAYNNGAVHLVGTFRDYAATEYGQAADWYKAGGDTAKYEAAMRQRAVCLTK